MSSTISRPNPPCFHVNQLSGVYAQVLDDNNFFRHVVPHFENYFVRHVVYRLVRHFHATSAIFCADSAWSLCHSLARQKNGSSIPKALEPSIFFSPNLPVLHFRLKSLCTNQNRRHLELIKAFDKKGVFLKALNAFLQITLSIRPQPKP